MTRIAQVFLLSVYSYDAFLAKYVVLRVTAVQSLTLFVRWFNGCSCTVCSSISNTYIAAAVQSMYCQL
jgi:hypothetical protein